MAAALDSASYCDTSLREHDRDRWLAHLFAPEAHRPALAALYAFNIEIARVRDLVSGPMPGEVRLQWWADVLEGHGRGEVSSHPVAQALLGAIERYRLPKKPFLDLIEARRFDLYDDPMPSLADLEGYCGETASALFRLASLILANGEEPGFADMPGHAGVAYALTGLLRAFPAHAARGQIYLPADILARQGASTDDIFKGIASPPVLAALAELRAEARRHLVAAAVAAKGAPASVRLSSLPAALSELWLMRMDKPGYQPFRDVVEVAPWRRQWTLWRAARQAQRR